MACRAGMTAGVQDARYVVLILAVLLAAPELAAQQIGAPRVVTLLDDLTGRPVQGASVTVEPGGLQRISDPAGEIRVPLPAGAFTLSGAWPS